MARRGKRELQYILVKVGWRCDHVESSSGPECPQLLEAELNAALDSVGKTPHSVYRPHTAERAFSSGRDIKEMAESAEAAVSLPGAERDYNLRLAFGTKPTIGAINGLAYGGGALLASSLDLRIGCERSQFRFLGTSAGRLNSTWTLAVQIGMPKAKELLLSSRPVEPEEAHKIGLLNHLVGPAHGYDSTRLAIEIRLRWSKVKQLLNNTLGCLGEMAATELQVRETRSSLASQEASAISFRDGVRNLTSRHERITDERV
jgi:enoyl-CoA hydratase/carnithine racemase